MPLNGAALLVGGTCSATGGTSKTFTVNGQRIQNGVQTIDTSETNGLIRPSMTYRSVDGQYDATKKMYTPDRRECVTTRPKILSDGSIDFAGFRTIYTGSREVTVAELAILRNQHAQVLFDTDFDAFWTSGSLA